LHCCLRLLYVVLITVLLPAPVFAWGHGHGSIRHWAIERLPEWQHEYFGAEHLQKLGKDYTSLQDGYAGSKSPALAPYCVPPGLDVSLHDLNSAKRTVPAMHWYWANIVEELQAGENDEAMKFLGVLCHWNEDPISPSMHSSPVSEGVMRMLVPPQGNYKYRNYLYGYKSIYLDAHPRHMPDVAYTPKLIGTTVEQAAFNLHWRQRALSTEAVGYIVPIILAKNEGDTDKAYQLIGEIARKNGELVADIIYTAGCLAADRIDTEQAAALNTVRLTDILPVNLIRPRGALSPLP